MSLISDNVSVFTTSHQLKAEPAAAAMRLVGSDVSAESTTLPILLADGGVTGSDARLYCYMMYGASSSYLTNYCLLYVYNFPFLGFISTFPLYPLRSNSFVKVLINAP